MGEVTATTTATAVAREASLQLALSRIWERVGSGGHAELSSEPKRVHPNRDEGSMRRPRIMA
jgi:hypothetical protein